MTTLEKFDNLNRKISLAIEWVGVLALILMMLITTVDVIGAKVFHKPVFGSLDIMMIAQLVAISFAVSIALMTGRHVQVEFFAMILPERGQALLDIIVNLLGLALFAVIVWRLAVYGHDLQVDGEVSSTARIPLYPYAYGAAFACIPVCLVYLCYLFQSVVKVFKK